MKFTLECGLIVIVKQTLRGDGRKISPTERPPRGHENKSLFNDSFCAFDLHWPDHLHLMPVRRNHLNNNVTNNSWAVLVYNILYIILCAQSMKTEITVSRRILFLLCCVWRLGNLYLVMWTDFWSIVLSIVLRVYHVRERESLSVFECHKRLKTHNMMSHVRVLTWSFHHSALYKQKCHIQNSQTWES